MIRETKKGYKVVSESGKNLGEKNPRTGKPYSKEEAKKRLQQVEYFKHLSKSGGR